MCKLVLFLSSNFQDDFHFEYTECDSDGGRWRVSVPKEGQCEGGNPFPPKRGKDCSEYWQ